MKLETNRLLARAKDDLADAEKIAAIGLTRIATRSCYFAAFHAAEAYIFERSGRSVKTHSGLRAEFARLVKDLPGGEKALTAFLARAYKYKEISDYGIGAEVPPADAETRELIEIAARFVGRIAALLAA